MVSARKIRLTWLAYLPVGFIVLYAVMRHLIVGSFISYDYMLLLVLAILVAFFPIRTDETVFSLTSGVSLATFVIYGLTLELFLSSIALMAVIIRSDIKLDQHYRYPLNLMMVAILSVLSAGAFYGTENLLASLNIQIHGVLPVLMYMFVHLIANQFIVYITNKYYYRREGASFFNQRLRFSFLTNFFVIPLSFILFYLYFEMGTLGILIGALPFLMVTIGFNYYHVVRSNNTYLTKVNKASQRLSGKMSRKGVLNSFIKSLLEIFPAERIFYFKVIQGRQIILERVINQDKTVEQINQEMVLTDNSVLSKALDTQAIGTYSKSRDWFPLFSFDLNYKAESAMVLPVHIATQNKGIILMVNQKQSIFNEYIISLVEVFYQYFITVLDNANHYEKLETSNVTDYLTNLPNLRGFSKELKVLAQKGDFEFLSVVILDLDHFKKVNDVHGHEAGNDMLRQVADVLRDFKGENEFIARYGGEEFIICLKDYDREKAYTFTEEVRKAIGQASYHINYSIAIEESATLSVTASLGIATYPNDTDDVYELISLADRVMYTGSKRSGRNKVTAFERES